MNPQTSNLTKVAVSTLSAPKMILLASFAFGCIPDVGLCDPFNLTEIAPGIYVHQGRQVGLDSPQRDDIANIGFIIGEKCVAVIDTGGSIKTGRRLRKALQGVSTKPVCYIINTHVHYDHVLGNHAFAQDKAKIVGHRRLAAAVENNRTFFLESFPTELENNANSDWIKGPDMTVSKTKVLALGKRNIRLTAHPRSHSNTDLSVLDSQTGTLWIADLLFVQHLPVLNGSINAWLKETEKLQSGQSGDVSRIVPGHGTIPKDWRVAVGAQTRYLKKLRREIRSIIKKGGFLEDALQSVGQSEKGRWLLFDENHKRNITRAFAELEWE